MKVVGGLHASCHDSDTKKSTAGRLDPNTIVRV